MTRRSLFLLGILVSTSLGAEYSPTATGTGSPSPSSKPPSPSSSATKPAAPPVPAILRWRNGETLAGEVAGASVKELAWKAAAFEDPLRIQWPVLRRIDRPLPAVACTETFSFDLRDGSHLYGDLVAVSDQIVTMKSARHGEVALKRSEVLSVRRLRGSGPTGDFGWSDYVPQGQSTPNRTPVPGAIPSPTVGPGGSLSLPYFNRSAKLGLALPQLVDLEFRVRSSLRPDFRLVLDGGAKDQLRIETWEDDLVIVAGDQFKIIRSVAENEHDVALRLTWDRKQRLCTVYSPLGAKLVEWTVPEVTGNTNAGLVLSNKGRDLALDLLRVRSWSGQAPATRDGKLPYLELADGRIMQGAVGKIAGGTVQMPVVGQDAAAEYPLSDVDTILFSNDAAKISEPAARLSFADGEMIMGKVASYKESKVELATDFTEAPLATALDGMRQLLLRAPAAGEVVATPPLTELDEIAVGSTTLHGKVVSDGADWPRWLPVGGSAPSRPSTTLATTITRNFAPDAQFNAAPALFYRRNGDVVPGTLRSLDRQGVEIQSTVVSATRLPSSDIDAIQFGGSNQRNLKGFDDAGWRLLKGDKNSLRLEGDSITLEPTASFGHPTALQSSEVRFTLRYRSYCTLRLRLFCAGVDGNKATNLAIMHSGDRVSAGTATNEGQFETQQQTRVPQGDVEVRLVIQEKFVELYVNDFQLLRMGVDPAKRAGSGLIIEPTSMWGNNVNPITLAGFSARLAPGRTSLPEIAPDTRLQALTVPRFRKEDLPRHALVAANGDVLRGEIEAATGSHFGFRSGLENLRVPRDRVQAVIWLKPPDKDAAAASVKKLVPSVLDQKLTSRVRYGRANLRSLTMAIQRDAPSLQFKYPEGSDNRMFPMQLGVQTVGEALDELCSLFGLRYRLEDGKTVIFEAGPAAVAGMVQRVYWLKPDSFPATPSARDVLVGKGLEFPPKATVTWEPENGELTMVNSEANHAKLAEIMTANYGGSLGSPTHWLILTNGARLGLAIDKIDQDIISAHHPIYGQCKIPAADVYVIRTSAPEASSVRKAVSDWQLVLAPEPVIPESGSEKSPSIGKEAKPFKLPLLGGGDFELTKEKGKVVVLDFWATWCGPCIKSLPSLIEAIGALPADKVKLIGVNQSEPPEAVKRFLETRGWKLTVALDANASVANQYGVEGIPHTVIVGPDGKVAWVKSGYSAEGGAEAAKAVKDLLDGVTPPAPTAPTTPATPAAPAAK